jgi:hypothetical protein
MQDIKEQSVNIPLLTALFVLSLCPLLFWTDSLIRMITIILVISSGALLLHIFPDRLGEADVIYLASMAAVLPYWSFVLAVCLGCVGCLVCFVWLARGGRNEVYSDSLPFLPSLYWGAITVVLGGLHL